MHISEPFDERLYQRELLRAKLEVRDHYINNVVSDIYENTGQLLSLVRVQLTMLAGKLKEELRPDIDETGNLVTRVIRDLRAMSRNFYPEKELLTGEGFINAIKNELRAEGQDPPPKQFIVTGVPVMPDADRGLVFFNVVLDIISLLKNKKKGLPAIAINYTEKKVLIKFRFRGELLHEIDDNYQPQNHELNISQRIQLIGGAISAKNNTADFNEIGISIIVD